jgi:hypothetical protein
MTLILESSFLILSKYLLGKKIGPSSKECQKRNKYQMSGDVLTSGHHHLAISKGFPEEHTEAE